MLAEESFPEENRRLDIAMAYPKCLEQQMSRPVRNATAPQHLVTLYYYISQWIPNDVALAAASQLADAEAGLPSTPAEPAPAAVAAAAASADAAAAASAAAAAQHSSKEGNSILWCSFFHISTTVFLLLVLLFYFDQHISI